ncbi:7-carboxy-7-deazaguanine synthase [Streptomyces anthocyanicus]|uniref:7-carboxy-7-deazaguanine synthase QueE n=1 Tax=Streptomyces TaxID=1883 RepID=UPI00087A6A70|nr:MULTISPECIES: 7-carboxy-7-deazaguanine synthase QueE [Streptomyces]REH24932.1 organic radical activating enzyme [Streptomyces sp. 2221.1]GGL84881.1 7-carboxy-7-deazaguanine synthase [Streptomyces anthocyanicus]SDT79883.1 Organic radical activating enzyme [Streptomyces sp. 2114.2]
MPRLVVNEIFGPTVQGEGPSSGRRCGFLRLGGCNLSCRWCDTPYTWDWKGVSNLGKAFDPRVELVPRDADEVADELIDMGVGLIVISGGEPLSQQERLLPVLRKLRAAGISMEIETNGTIAPTDAVISTGVRFNVSPKLSHAGDPHDRRIVPDALRELNQTDAVAFKFVCRTADDLDEVQQLDDSLSLRSIWIMPEGNTVHAVNRHLTDLADDIVRRKWNISTRLHVLAWEDKRGV